VFTLWKGQEDRDRPRRAFVGVGLEDGDRGELLSVRS
jgi:hypothetical protein